MLGGLDLQGHWNNERGVIFIWFGVETKDTIMQGEWRGLRVYNVGKKKNICHFLSTFFNILIIPLCGCYFGWSSSFKLLFCPFPRLMVTLPSWGLLDSVSHGRRGGGRAAYRGNCIYPALGNNEKIHLIAAVQYRTAHLAWKIHVFILPCGRLLRGISFLMKLWVWRNAEVNIRHELLRESLRHHWNAGRFPRLILNHQLQNWDLWAGKCILFISATFGKAIWFTVLNKSPPRLWAQGPSRSHVFSSKEERWRPT